MSTRWKPARWRWTLAASAALAVSGLAACGDDSDSDDGAGGTGGTGTDPCAEVGCAPCAPIQLVVLDLSSGDPIPDATITVDGDSCPATQTDGTTSCISFEGGDYMVTVSAPGYEDQTVTVTLDAPPPDAPGQCCGNCPPNVETTVEMSPMAPPGG